MADFVGEWSGVWHNQHGSEVHLDVSRDGRVTGKFQSGAGLAKGEACELVGFATKTLVSFTVNFSRHDSLTSWTGHLVSEDGRPTIHTIWNMSVATPHPTDPESLWKGVWTGADTFRRGPAGDRPRTLPMQPSHPVREWLPEWP